MISAPFPEPLLGQLFLFSHHTFVCCIGFWLHALGLGEFSGYRRRRCPTEGSVGRAVPFGPHSVVGSDVDGVRGGVVADGQAEVRDAARPVLLHQNVL